MQRIDTTNPTSRNRYVTVVLSGTVTAKDVLMLDNTKTGDARWYTMLRAAAGVATGQPLAAGVASIDGVTGDRIQVQVEGIASAKSAGLAQDNYCVVDATAASLEVYAKADHDVPFAIAMGATSGGFTDVLLLNPLNL